MQSQSEPETTTVHFQLKLERYASETAEGGQNQAGQAFRCVFWRHLTDAGEIEGLVARTRWDPKAHKVKL